MDRCWLVLGRRFPDDEHGGGHYVKQAVVALLRWMLAAGCSSAFFLAKMAVSFAPGRLCMDSG
eukprot:10205450-Prorocentrum_lima.AAC.1